MYHARGSPIVVCQRREEVTKDDDPYNYSVEFSSSTGVVVALLGS